MTFHIAYDEEDEAARHVQLSADIAAAIARVATITEGFESGRVTATPASVRLLENATAELEHLVAQLP